MTGVLTWLKRNAPDWRTVISATLIVFAFPPWDLSPLIWVALIPWFWALDRASSPKAAFVQGLWLGFLMTMGGLYWVAFVLQEFGGLPWPLAIIGLLLFSLIGQPQFLFFAPLRVYLLKRFSGQNLLILALALVFVGFDWGIPKLFPQTLGHSLYQAHWLRQTADLGGVTFSHFSCTSLTTRSGTWDDEFWAATNPAPGQP